MISNSAEPPLLSRNIFLNFKLNIVSKINYFNTNNELNYQQSIRFQDGQLNSNET